MLQVTEWAKKAMVKIEYYDRTRSETVQLYIVPEAQGLYRTIIPGYGTVQWVIRCLEFKRLDETTFVGTKGQTIEIALCDIQSWVNAPVGSGL